jgi:predicted metalloendopeptidase
MATPTNAESRDPVTTYNPQELATLSSSTPGFDWSAYFASVGAGDVRRVNAVAPAYLQGLGAQLKLGLQAWKSYLTFRTLEAYGDSLGAGILAEEARFHSGVFYGTTSVPPDFAVCRQQTAEAFPFELAKPFVAYRSSLEDRDAATAIYARVVTALEEDLTESKWLDAPSRDQALAKLDALVAHIAFPDEADWPQTTFPSQVGSYLGQRLDVVGRRWSEAWASLSQPVDRRAWLAPIVVANAWYDPTANAVTLPAGILQFPEYTAKRRSVLNYGTLGAVLGHELTHAFDDSGRHFDGEGRLRDWWTAESAAEYEHRASCLSDQYASYEALPGLSLDGQLTLGENIADLGGLKLAYAAYRASAIKDAAQGQFDAAQLFFLSYAQLECANFSDSYTTELVLTDPHSPPRFRVNGVVRNMPEFQEAFHCPAGAELAPVDRCGVF